MGTLTPLSDRIWVLSGGVNIGVLRGDDGDIALIDTGLNETSAKKALRAVREELGDDVSAVLTTHAHADHFGGNAAVVKRAGAAVHAPAIDEAFLRYPLLQPASLFGGADPVDTLRGGFLLAEPSPVDVVVLAGRHEIVGVRIEAVPLYGHSPGQLGYVIDDVFFCADVVLPGSVLDKYRIPYLFSLSDHLSALERARAVGYRIAAPGHGPQVGTLEPLIDLNRDLARDVMTAVLEIATLPATAGAILAQLLRRFGGNVQDAPSYYLLQPTVFAYLSHLHREGLVTHEVRDGESLWRRA